MSFERDNIRSMTGYASGEQPMDPATIKLNTNENPYPPSPHVADVLAAFDPSTLRRYPPATAAMFRIAAAQQHQLEPENVIATRGGDELLRLVITTFVDPGERIGMSNPTYSLYPVLAQIQDCPIVEVSLEDDWTLPLDFAQQMNAAGVKLTFVVNPHAPSGVLLPFERLGELASELDSILLLDEAYIDFVDAPYASEKLIADHDNVIILRTLSKGYSLAGLRFGYGLADEKLIAPMMNKTRDSYNLDAISQQIAVAALNDQTYAQSCWQKTLNERSRMHKALSDLGFSCPPSQANFLLATVPETMAHSAEALYEKLKEQHILVRFFSTENMSNKLRISIGSDIENTKLLDQLTQLLA